MIRSHRLRLLLVFALLLGASAMGRAADAQPDPFSKRIRLVAWGDDLNSVLQEFMTQTPVGIIVSRHIATPREFKSFKFYLLMNNLSVRDTLEVICRQLHCYYVMTGPDSAHLTTGYDWVELSPPKVMLENIEYLLAYSHNDREQRAHINEFATIAHELIKENALFEPTCVLRIEDQRPEIKIVATLPDALKKRLTTALHAMATPGQPLRPIRMPAIGREEQDLHEKLRAPVIAVYRDQELRKVIEDLRLQTGINIGFDLSILNDTNTMAPVTLNLPEVAAADALEALAAQLGFKGIEIHPPNLVWLSERPGVFVRMRSRRLLWNDVVVRAYDVSELRTYLDSNEALPHHIRQNVRPTLWDDASTAVVFHEKSGNLIVVAPPEDQTLVAAALYDLQQRLAENGRSTPEAQP